MKTKLIDDIAYDDANEFLANFGTVLEAKEAHLARKNPGSIYNCPYASRVMVELATKLGTGKAYDSKGKPSRYLVQAYHKYQEKFLDVLDNLTLDEYLTWLRGGCR